MNVMMTMMTMTTMMVMEAVWWDTEISDG